MMISTKGRYAVRVMIELAVHETEACIPLEEIARHQEISKKYLEAIVKRLVRAGLVIGLRGKGGGYRLARTPDTYTVAEILREAEGPLVPVACLEPGAKACQRAETCATLPMWRQLMELTEVYLKSVTLQDLAQQALKNGEKDGLDAVWEHCGSCQ